jgi:hypothetical protein
MAFATHAQDDFDFDFDFDFDNSKDYQQDGIADDEFDGDSYRLQMDEGDMPADSNLPQKDKKKAGPVKWEDVKAQKSACQPTHTASIQ